MKNNPKFYFDPESGSSMCVIETKNKTYVGTAQCADSDRDMISERTGCEIAYRRAFIKTLEDRDEELKIRLKALKEYYYSMNTSKWFNPNSYEARRLDDHIKMTQDDIKITKVMLKSEKEALKMYMDNKAKIYKKIRDNKKADSNK